MVDQTDRLALDTYAQGEDNWDHTDTVELFDELAIDKGPVADRPASGNYDDQFFYATDQRTLWRWDAGTSDWNAAAGLGANGDPIPGTSYFENVDAGSLNTEGVAIGPSGARRPWGDTIHLFGVGGQSNAQGRGDATQSPPVNSGVGYEWDESAQEFVTLSDPVGNAQDGSAWPMFVRRYYQLTGIPVAVVPAAVGGSAQTAAADTGSGNWSGSGSLRDDLKTELENAKAELEALGFQPVVRGVLWSQGERDAQAIDAGTITKSDYKNAFQTFVNEINDWSVLSQSWGLYVFQTAKETTGDTAGYEAVRAAQREVARGKQLVEHTSRQQLEYPDRGLMTGSIHYNQAGLNELGRRGAEQILRGDERINGTGTRIFLDSAQSIGSSLTQVDFDTLPQDAAYADPYDQFDQTGEIVIEEDGIYNVSGTVTWDSAIPDGVGSIGFVEVNQGSERIDADSLTTGASDNNSLDFSVQHVQLATDDSLRVIVKQSSGSSVSLTTGQQWTNLSVSPVAYADSF